MWQVIIGENSCSAVVKSSRVFHGHDGLGQLLQNSLYREILGHCSSNIYIGWLLITMPNQQFQSTEGKITIRKLTRMALSRAHIFAKAADPAKLLLLNKCYPKPNPTVTWSRLPS